MLLYVVRHAYAGERGDARFPDDDLRPLTTDGRKRFKKTVKALAAGGFAPQVVAASPLVRCRQTADVIDEVLAPASGVIEVDALRPGGGLKELLVWTSDRQEEQIAWVGHAPDVERLLAGLLTEGEMRVRFSKGAVACVEFDARPLAARARLRWYITAKSLGL